VLTERLLVLSNTAGWSSKRNQKLLRQIVSENQFGQSVVHRDDFVKFYNAKMESVFPYRADFELVVQAFMALALNSSEHSPRDQLLQTEQPDADPPRQLSPTRPPPAGADLQLRDEIQTTKGCMLELRSSKQAAEAQVSALIRQINQERRDVRDVLQGAKDKLNLSEHNLGLMTERYTQVEQARQQLKCDCDVLEQAQRALRDDHAITTQENSELKRQLATQQQQHEAEMARLMEKTETRSNHKQETHLLMIQNAALRLLALADCDSPAQMSLQEGRWIDCVTEDKSSQDTAYLDRLTPVSTQISKMKLLLLQVQQEQRLLAEEHHEQSLQLETAQEECKRLSAIIARNTQQHAKLKDELGDLLAYHAALYDSSGTCRAELEFLRSENTKLMAQNSARNKRTRECAEQCAALWEMLQSHGQQLSMLEGHGTLIDHVQMLHKYYFAVSCVAGRSEPFAIRGLCCMRGRLCRVKRLGADGSTS